jgi:hypothetical protein
VPAKNVAQMDKLNIDQALALPNPSKGLNMADNKDEKRISTCFTYRLNKHTRRVNQKGHPLRDTLFIQQ